jgi:hypothetical protein
MFWEEGDSRGNRLSTSSSIFGWLASAITGSVLTSLIHTVSTPFRFHIPQFISSTIYIGEPSPQPMLQVLIWGGEGISSTSWSDCVSRHVDECLTWSTEVVMELFGKVAACQSIFSRNSAAFSFRSSTESHLHVSDNALPPTWILVETGRDLKAEQLGICQLHLPIFLNFYHPYCWNNGR